MALSQKHVGKMLVPWFNSKEWKHVNNLIFANNSTDIEKLQALEILQMWKIRTPKLPSGVEGTLIILDALSQKKDSVSEDKLRILYGASIMRFLNLCGAINDKQGTFYKTAKQNNLPDWLVDLRHDIAHDQIIPSKFMLLMGLEFCLNWLKNEYWDKQNIIIKDFIIEVGYNQDISSIVEVYSQINLAYYLGNIHTITDISEQDSLLMEKLNSLKIVECDDSNTDVKDLLEILFKKIKEQDFYNLEDCISESIINEGSILAIKEQQDENGKDELPRNFVMIWQDLIQLLYLKNMLYPLFKKLIEIVNSIELTEQTRKNASLWLAELCKSLLLAKNIYNQYKDLSPSNGKLNKETVGTILKHVILQSNPELKECLQLDFQHCENIIHDINHLRLDILKNPHKFTLIYVKYFLQVIGCSDEYINNNETFINNYLHPQITFGDSFNQLHTLEEYQQITNEIPVGMEVTIENYDTEITLCISPTETERAAIPQKRWRVVEDTSIFAGCPLGVLANQDRATNPLLSLEAL